MQINLKYFCDVSVPGDEFIIDSLDEQKGGNKACLVPQTRSTVYVFADFVYGTASHYIAQAISHLKPFSVSLPRGETTGIHHRASKSQLFSPVTLMYTFYICV